MVARGQNQGSARKAPTIAIVGAGNLGSALAFCLWSAGFSVREIVSREGTSSRRRAQTLARKLGACSIAGGKSLSADVAWFCVPDREIGGCARDLADPTDWRGKIALHSSGALSSDELEAVRRQGAHVASAHPLMTFVPGVIPSLAGVGFAVEGDAAAVRVARRLIAAIGGRVFPIRKHDKAAYHAWGTFLSPLLTALLATSESVAAAAGVERSEARTRALPITRQTVENYATWGAARGFSGPIVRGDAATVKGHMRVLRKVPGAREVYRALARAALLTLPAKNRKQLEQVLGKR